MRIDVLLAEVSTVFSCTTIGRHVREVPGEGVFPEEFLERHSAVEIMWEGMRGGGQSSFLGLPLPRCRGTTVPTSP
jgi:hypothetical protein